MRQLFVIGDSISMHYGPYLAEALGEAFAYARKTGEEPPVRGLGEAVCNPNGHDSNAVLSWLEPMLVGGWHPDLLLLNCGLHDIKTDPVTGAKQVPLDRYRQNLERIAGLLSTAGIATIWLRITPVDDATHNANTNRSFFRYAADVAAYNAAADDIMGRAGFTILDLHAFCCELGLPEAFCDHVHYVEEARRRQGRFIADFIRTRFAPESGRRA